MGGWSPLPFRLELTEERQQIPTTVKVLTTSLHIGCGSSRIGRITVEFRDTMMQAKRLVHTSGRLAVRPKLTVCRSDPAPRGLPGPDPSRLPRSTSVHKARLVSTEATAVKTVPKTGVLFVPVEAPYLERTDLLGKDDWQGLFTAGDRDNKTFSKFTGPRGAAMQAELIKYGDLSQLTYNNFHVVKLPSGRSEGTFRHFTRELVQLPCQYPYPASGTDAAVSIPEDSAARLYSNIDDPVFFLSATSGFYRGEFPGAILDIQSYNWIGFVAISQPDPGTKLRDIVVAWRGTSQITEWMSDIADSFADWDGIGDGNVKVALGFEAMYRHFGATAGNTLSLQGQVQVAVRKLLEKYGDQVGSITTTGHSLGGALASLSAFDIANSQINKQGDDINGSKIPVTAFTFEAPRVGNEAYAAAFKDPDLGLKQLRVENLNDVVPLAPALEFQMKFLLPFFWPKLVEFLKGIWASTHGRPESRARNAFRQAGSLFLVDSDALDKKALGIQEHPKLITGLHQRHNLPLVMYMIDPSRPLPVDPQAGIKPKVPAGGPPGYAAQAQGTPFTKES
ncbi:hypothetical protein WJX72_009297 [[Myrmecia] bisecta]|uniref:Fungal lipase-type domain-containing protein n=1 Tax=[Myrmecia] bisecta TaxID=41462 RepID=A0AAW1QS25_9CHLO